MARKLRVQYEGAIYHLINRGDRRELIFKDDKDRELFLETSAKPVRKPIGESRWYTRQDLNL